MGLDQTFAALSDPTRRALLAHLALGEATVSELAAPHDLSQPAISKHLKVLEQAGLIETRIDAQSRPRRLSPEAFAQVEVWIAQIKDQWELRLDRLETFINTDTPQNGES